MCNILLYFQANNDTCIWYDECETVGGLPLNCYYNGPAKPITDPMSLNVLQKWCPDFIQDYLKGKPKTIFALNF